MDRDNERFGGPATYVENVNYDLYTDIARRTDGEIYIGVVGPVRTGKSTFIKKFLSYVVLPSIDNEHVRRRTLDELPVSGVGSTITTIEPKFIPANAPLVTVLDNINVKLRMIDCVGFPVEKALGMYENDRVRLVRTPWSEEDIPFATAAVIGTKKVIREHSSVGVVVTTDGSFGDIDRDSFVKAEKEIVEELQAIGKPYIIVLNTSRVHHEDTERLKGDLSRKYHREVIAVDVEHMNKEDIRAILDAMLKEFYVSQISFTCPGWLCLLDNSHWLMRAVVDTARKLLDRVTYIKDVYACEELENADGIENVGIESVNMGTGEVVYNIKLYENMYYQILSELTKTSIENEYELINMLRELSDKRKSYELVKDALSEVDSTGFGIVTPRREDIVLGEPELIKNGSRFGVKLKASVPSINLLKTNISIEIAPIVGSKGQAEDLIDYIKNNDSGIWSANIFGKTVEQIVNDGIYEKTHNITGENMDKISQTIERVMNENSGLICLIV